MKQNIFLYFQKKKITNLVNNFDFINSFADLEIWEFYANHLHFELKQTVKEKIHKI